jgi:hypothetical protein
LTTHQPDADAQLIKEAKEAIQEFPKSSATTEQGDATPSWWSTSNAMTMSSVVLLFGIIVLGLAAWLVRAGHSATSVLRVFGTVLVIVMVTFLVVAGYDDKQIAAPLGLLGTIVGYLLGRDVQRPSLPKE